MTWPQAIEQGSRGGIVGSKKEFREVIKAWRDFVGIHDGPDPKWDGPGMYEFYNNNEIIFKKLKEAKYA